jgi:valyl-tRNA synthetase
MEELAKTYDPSNVESRWYDEWEKNGYLSPDAKAVGDKPAYTIVIPPPNVTGSLHMGHALNSTLQDALIRYHKMNGHAALWVPGTDHGGIATQNVVEKILKNERVSRQDLGREKFLERMWAWRKEAGDTILMQLRKLGATLDWTRTRFTMDEVCSKAVRHAFVELYNKKLLYRGFRLVNWCPRCHTALADIEVEHKDVKGHLWHIRYPLAERRKEKRSSAKKKELTPPSYEKGYVVVATTRPETMLGDTAVAVHPKDRRYKGIVGNKVTLPLTGREISVIADDVIDKSFGSGAVKVTPSHDPTDFEIGARHKLPHITVIGFDGKMTEAAGPAFAGMDRFDARKKVVEELEKLGLLEKVEDHNLAVSVCYRCDSVIEPLESEQWFLSMKQMAKKALDASKKGKVKIVPESWESPYRLWLKNLRDWCVSRQIWWGHRIPAWYCKSKKTCPPIVSLEDPTSCPTCKGKDIEQDADVLDTWFSSALWPFSVFKWPEETADLKRFYPTSTLVTGHEILYLWVARMVMFGLEFNNKVPFNTVLIHGIVRDKQGRKMSKSIGNVIDPLDLIKEFGADAVRFSLAQSAAPGRDMQISKENFVMTRNFSNKVWNATRFSLMNLAGMSSIPPRETWEKNLELADQWILHRYNDVIRETTKAIEAMDLDAASRGLYDFFWGDFCDWYLEMVKPRLLGDNPSAAARATLATVLEGTLRLLHPFMPFITEELWQKIPKPEGEKSPHLMAAAWPQPAKSWDNKSAFGRMKILQEMVTKLRAIRSEMGIPVTQPIDVMVKSSEPETIKLIEAQKIILQSLNSRVGNLSVDAKAVRPKASAAAIIPGADLYVPLEGLIDFAKERARLEKELLTVKEDSERMAKKLSNQDFVTHAPKEEIEKAQGRLKESKERAVRLEQNINALS